ncbi:MAG: fibronectin type III domain-containing protein [Acidobacteriota bacterium]
MSSNVAPTPVEKRATMTTLPNPAAASPRRSIRRLVPVLAVMVLAAACGKKGDPLPPLRTVPLVTKDLEVRQQGSAMLFELTYPATTSAGLILGGIDSLELYRITKPMVGDDPPTAQAAEFEADSEVVRSLRGTELESAIVGNRIQFRLSMETPDEEPPEASIFAVRTIKGLESSDFSNRATLVPGPPPEPPTNLELIARPRGVEIRWESGEAEAFDVFRRLATERGYGPPLMEVPGDKRRIADLRAKYGERYIYSVRAITGDDPRVESDLASEAEIDYQDTFAPRLPKNVVALPEQGAIRLRWEPSPDADTVGYFIHRRDVGRVNFVRLNDQPLPSTEYLDRGLASGLEFAYRIQAVDGEGNTSDLSPAVVAATR